MVKSLLSLSIILLVAGPVASTAADKTEPAKPAAVPANPPELSQLNFFLGAWNCDGKAFANDMGPEHATKAVAHTVLAVGGRWLRVNYDEQKTAANAMPYHVEVHMGYDGGKKKFVEQCVDVMGGYCTQYSDGWNGDAMTFEGAINVDGQQATGRDVFVKKSASEFTHTGSFQGADKKWTNTDEETCRKSS